MNHLTVTPKHISESDNGGMIAHGPPIMMSHEDCLSHLSPSLGTLIWIHWVLLQMTIPVSVAAKVYVCDRLKWDKNMERDT